MSHPLSSASRVQRWFTHSLPGRAFVAGVALKLIAVAASRVAPGAASLVDASGTIAFLVAGIGLVQQIVGEARRSRLLWHVRRKLTTSYIFIGFVPALLIIIFFVLCGLLLFFNVSSYLMESRIRSLVDEGRFLSQATVLEVQNAGSPPAFVDAMTRRYAAAARRYPGVSIAVVPATRTCPKAPGADAVRAPAAGWRAKAGPWAHVDPPTDVPAWVSCGGHAGLIAYEEGAGTPGAPGRTRAAVRAVTLPETADPRYAVIVDIPLAGGTMRQLREDTGIEIGDLSAITTSRTEVRPMPGRAVAGPETPPAVDPSEGDRRGVIDRPLNWFAFLDFTDWRTGQQGSLAAAIGMSPGEVYRRISATPVRIGALSFGQVLLLLLALVGGLFVVIEVIAFVMGLGLARSITGSIHELFVGTGRIRAGDFTYKIPIHTRDQLGELAESFNEMTTSIEGLLQEKAEKERLEEELRIARNIQMSLLPQGPLQMPGIAISAYCEPAREVGGDYYDFLPLDEHRLGVLIADVSGKGTSAALYMAELKGLMLALGRRHDSPRALLVEANRILADHLDARSFITITYAIIDIRDRTMTYARAGHCPLLYLPGAYTDVRSARLLAPDGMVLGLKLDRGEMFERLLCEETIPLRPGDIVVLFTDGISEAMNTQMECFGEGRLTAVVEAHCDLPFEDLRDRVIHDVHTFVGDSAAHDDMTMLLLKVDGD